MAQQQSERAPYSLRLRLFAEQCLRQPGSGGAEPATGDCAAGAAGRRHPLLPPPGQRPGRNGAEVAAAAGWPRGLEAASEAATAALEEAAARLAAAAAAAANGSGCRGDSVRGGGMATRLSLVQVRRERKICGARARARVSGVGQPG